MKNLEALSKKSLGQNFLVNKGIAKKMVQASVISGPCGVLEIGPGFGALTMELAANFKKVLAVEIDKNLAKILEENLAVAKIKNVKLMCEDVLKMDLRSLIKKEFAGMCVVCVANLPYYITSPILVKLLEQSWAFLSITVMTQKELGVRICAPLGTRQVSALSFRVRFLSVPKLLFFVSKGSFRPTPKIESAVIKLRMLKTPSVCVKDEQLMFELIKCGFSQRRKLLINSLNGVCNFGKSEIKAIFNAIKINEMVRVEQMNLKMFAELANSLLKENGGKKL
ncbi:MAG: 16S rRNA (adenine(1518)-N(6)/adenine(1519)-N(6))-dimethyltransferase RsmA [Oscillospiraceae bacterium]|jgi:16S rRNA (adenine1518-N6/adenine1519-N6)-dimethyltransferase|nr:16S rRNA (adenine(1518)-N(6)/adenine(1519)-N(6))-dimethyltransferase RsmA [Oscillospiraceae bacterium]